MPDERELRCPKCGRRMAYRWEEECRDYADVYRCLSGHTVVVQKQMVTVLE